MTSLLSSLPAPKNTLNVFNKAPREEAVQKQSTAVVSTSRKIPPYGKRTGWAPRTPEDFGDGGAFPEIHMAQYPLGMGLKESGDSLAKTVPVTFDSQGRVRYESIVNPGSSKQLQVRLEDANARLLTEEQLKRPDAEEEAKTAEETRKELERLAENKLVAAQPTNPAGIQNNRGQASFIRYTPAQQGINFNNSTTSTRIIRLTEAVSDPLEPAKFKHKKVPRGPPSPPSAVMHSPPRKVTAKDQADWKIPPCISNWKNNKGYAIPLDKRLAADGRGLAEVQINDNFAKLSESLYIAERTAREEVQKRAEMERLLNLRERERKEEMLRRLAQEARAERAAASSRPTADEDEEKDRAERDQIREERRRERERDLRMQRNKSQASRNADRDIGEKIALGMAVPTKNSGETMFDQRLFNQTEGMDSGFGEEDGYNVFTKPLFTGSAANAIYKPKQNVDDETYGGEEAYNKLLDTSKFQPDRGFSGATEAAEKSKGQGGRSKPVEFEKQSADPFGLDEFLTQAKTSTRSNLDKIGSRGHMSVGSADTSSTGSKRGQLEFEEEGKSKKNRNR